MIVATLDYPHRRAASRRGVVPGHQRMAAAPEVPKPTKAPPPPPASAPPAPKPAPKPVVPDLPTPTYASWAEAMDKDRRNQLPITDMKSGGYGDANTAWMDRAFHPKEAIHPNELQRRNLRGLIAESRILDIANGNKRGRLRQAGVNAPDNTELLRDYSPAADPSGGTNPWYGVGEGTRRKWHVYKKLEALERAAKIQPYTHVHAFDAYLAKGGTLQGYAESFSVGLGRSAIECRRDRFGACVTDSDFDSTQSTEPTEGEAGGFQPATPDPIGAPPISSLQRSTVTQDHYTLQHYIDPGAAPPTSSLQRATPTIPGGVALSRSGSTSQNQSAGSSAAAAMSTAASTHVSTASASGNVSGYGGELGFSLRDITRPLEKITSTVIDPFEFRKGIPQGAGNLADLLDFVGPIASAVPHPYAQGGAAAAGSLADILHSFSDGRGTTASDIFDLLARLGPGAAQPYEPPVAPPVAPPSQSSMQTMTPLLIGAGALAAGLLIMGGRR